MQDDRLCACESTQPSTLPSALGLSLGPILALTILAEAGRYQWFVDRA